MLRVGEGDEDRDEEEDEGEGEESKDVERRHFGPLLGGRHRGALWYESLVQDTALGRVKKQKGGHAIGDGTVEVEWEVFEWTEGLDDEEGGGDITPGKRKLGEVEEPEDQEMRA